MRSLLGAAALVLLAQSASGHSWIEHITKIDPKTGTFTGDLGYGRSFIPRGSPGFNDANVVYRLPNDGAQNLKDMGKSSKRDVASTNNYETRGITPQMSICKANQDKQIQTSNYPRLSAAPGDMLSIIYLENGHVTLPASMAGRAEHSGTVYVYGTQNYKEGTSFLSVFKNWTADGSGGDKSGRLLATLPFDDSRCYQINDSPISKDRQSKYPVTTNFENSKELPCQSPVQLPQDLQEGTLSIFWVWDWPLVPGASAPQGNPEIYTGCADIDIKKAKKARGLEARQQNYANMAIMPQAQSQAPAASSPAAAPTQAAPPSAAQSPTQSPAATSAPAPAPTAAAAAQSVSIDVKALASAVAEELNKKSFKTVTVTQTAAPCDQLVNKPAATSVQAVSTPAAPSQSAVASTQPAANTPAAKSSPASTANANSIATAIPGTMQFAPPMMSPTAASAVQSTTAYVTTSVSPVSSAQPQVASPVMSSVPASPVKQQTASPVSSGGVQATGYKGKRNCQRCQKRGSRIF